MNITPKDVRIRALFQSNFYKIPRFQRPYSWDRVNIEEFWSDAIELGRDGYFIGSMVLYGEKAGQDLFVVDGQQRLTTITIFLAALRDTFVEIGEDDLARGIQNIIQRVDISNKPRYVLLTESSYPYFQEYIQKLGAPDLKIKAGDEERGIQSAYNFAKEKFKSIRDQEAQEHESTTEKKLAIKKRLEVARDTILGLDVIVIQLDNEDDAYIVFETLNTRGKDLEQKDLIKNLLTRLLPAKSVDVDTTKIKWNAIMESLAQSAANIDASTYLHHFWLSRHDYTPERTLFNRVKAKITKEIASEFLDQLEQDVEIYRRIFEPENFSWPKEAESLKRSLQALAIFKVRQPTPLILSVLRAHRDGKASLRQAREVVAAVERFHFMHTAIAGTSSSGGVSMMYAAAGRDLSSEGDEQKRAKQLQELRAKLKARLPDRDSFELGFEDLHYGHADTRGRPLIRYILEMADAALRKDAPIDYSKMTIEHIAPQNPSVGEPASRFTAVGNLILVSEDLNQKLKNRSFADKKKLMNDAGLPLDAEINAAMQWTDDEISRRTKALARAIYDRDV